MDTDLLGHSPIWGTDLGLTESLALKEKERNSREKLRLFRWTRNFEQSKISSYGKKGAKYFFNFQSIDSGNPTEFNWPHLLFFPTTLQLYFLISSLIDSVWLFSLVFILFPLKVISTKFRGHAPNDSKKNRLKEKYAHF